VLVRVLKRRTSLEVSAEDFCRIELTTRDGQPDLNLSVYEAHSVGEVAQLYVEHAVSHISPPGKRAVLDVAGAGSPGILPTPGAAKFELAAERHRELLFEDAQSLQLFGRQVLEEADERRVDYGKGQVYDLVRQLRQDPAWDQGLQAAPQAARWLAKL